MDKAAQADLGGPAEIGRKRWKPTRNFTPGAYPLDVRLDVRVGGPTEAMIDARRIGIGVPQGSDRLWASAQRRGRSFGFTLRARLPSDPARSVGPHGHEVLRLP